MGDIRRVPARSRTDIMAQAIIQMDRQLRGFALPTRC